MGIAIVAFGANLGSPERKYRELIERLRRAPGVCDVRPSRLLATRPVGGPKGQPGFLNGALRIETHLPPEAFFEFLSGIETELGRVRGEHWGPREIDLDLLLYDDAVLHAERLTLPHPRMHYRRFVLAPAAEVAPEAVHPVFGMTIETLLANLDRTPRVVWIGGKLKDQSLAFAKELADQTGATLYLPPMKANEGDGSAEIVAVLEGRHAAMPPPQLLIWLSDLPVDADMPLKILHEQRLVGASSWSLLPIADWEASVAEAAAAVAAMRPVNGEWIEIESN